MIAFVAAAALMVAVACAWVLIPLLRRPRKDAIDRSASNLEILRDQLRELKAERARGLLSDIRFEQARGELERRVLEEAMVPVSDPDPVPRAGVWAAAMLGPLLPIGSIVLYLAFGDSAAILASAQKEKSAPGTHEVTQQDVAAMVGRLAERLKREPGNAEGWVLLGRSYNAMNRMPEAAQAYERAIALMPDNADVLADYADTLAAVHGRSLQGEPLKMIERALAIDPRQWKALALAGTEAFERKDYKSAIRYWERVKDSISPGSEISRSIDSSIAEARMLGAIDAPATAPVGAPKPAPAMGGPPSPAPTVAAPDATVAGEVRLAPALAAKALPGDIVYIFARATNGPRMPLAILRKQVKDLPVAFVLDDTMAMTEAAKLSGFAEVVVGARVSRSGNATPQSGDLEGTSPPVKLGMRGIPVVIDSTRP